MRVLADAARRRVTSPQPVNLAFGTSTSLLELIAAIEKEVGHGVEVARRPRRAGDVPHSQADPTRLRGLFPEVEAVPFEEALAATVEWFAQESRG